MIKTARLRAIAVTLTVYAALGSASAYLVWGASQGEHGLRAMAGYQAQKAELQSELGALKAEHERWRNKVNTMSQDAVDRDLLDEEAHALLNRVGKDEVMVIVDANPAR